MSFHRQAEQLVADGCLLAGQTLAFAAHQQDDVNSIKDIRISIGPAGPRPFRARAAEDTLRGKTRDEVIKPATVEAILAEAKFRTSPHGATAEYRRLLVSPMLEETCLAAWENSMVLPEDPENETSRELYAS